MKRSVVFLLTLLLLVPQTCAAPPSTELRFGTDELVYSVYAGYHIDAEAASVCVTFNESVKNYAYANFANGTLWIAIASAHAIALDEALGWVTAVDSEGRDFAPTLGLEILHFNGEAATGNLLIETVQADLQGETVNVSVAANDHFLSSYVLLAAAYDVDGKMLDSKMTGIAFEEEEETFSLTLSNCAEAACVKAFFMSADWTPISTYTHHMTDE